MKQFKTKLNDVCLVSDEFVLSTNTYRSFFMFTPSHPVVTPTSWPPTISQEENTALRDELRESSENNLRHLFDRGRDVCGRGGKSDATDIPFISMMVYEWLMMD